eukprot:GSA25T00017052001.1
MKQMKMMLLAFLSMLLFHCAAGVLLKARSSCSPAKDIVVTFYYGLAATNKIVSVRIGGKNEGEGEGKQDDDNEGEGTDKQGEEVSLAFSDTARDLGDAVLQKLVAQQKNGTLSLSAEIKFLEQLRFLIGTQELHLSGQRGRGGETLNQLEALSVPSHQGVDGVGPGSGSVSARALSCLVVAQRTVEQLKEEQTWREALQGQENGHAINYHAASEEARERIETIALESVQQDGLALMYAPPELRNSTQIVT